MVLVFFFEEHAANIPGASDFAKVYASLRPLPLALNMREINVKPLDIMVMGNPKGRIWKDMIYGRKDCHTKE